MNAAQLHTFVIPAYQESPYLEQCIQSLQAQTLKSQILLVTSTPCEYIEHIASAYGLPCYVNTKPSSIAGDWNFALQKAQTQWVTIAHQDDVYHPCFAEQLMKHRKDDVLIAFTDYDDIVQEQIRSFSVNRLVKRLLLSPFMFSGVVHSRFIKKAILAFGDPICCPSVTFHRNLLSWFSFRHNYTCALDWLAWLELAEVDGAFLYINQKLVQHRIHPESETSMQLDNGIRKQEELQIFERIWGRRIARLISYFYEAGHKDNLLHSIGK